MEGPSFCADTAAAISTNSAADEDIMCNRVGKGNIMVSNLKQLSVHCLQIRTKNYNLLYFRQFSTRFQVKNITFLVAEQVHCNYFEVICGLRGWKL